MSKVSPRIRRVDTNQPAIVKKLREHGATVLSLAALGRGCVDLLVGFRGENYLFEVKHGNGKLTADETEFFYNWRGQKALVRNAYEALCVLYGGEPDLPFDDPPDSEE